MHEPRTIRSHDRSPSVDAGPDRRATAFDASDERPDAERTDDADASAARRRYRSHGIEPLAPDRSIVPLLEPDEVVLARHDGVGLEGPQLATWAAPSVPMLGDLYVTSSRLVHVGPCVRTIELDDIEDATLAEDRVLLVTRGGVGITLETDRPRLLRVEMAIARAARTGPTRGGSRGSQVDAR